ncbi:Adenine-specific methyltransferase PglX [Priestia megaterium]|uniref:BREX-1 system adenine-specific DNA-methyltransferase PglX n=1 Tax=Priestia megaterium TaxID=1404 RepID=UPI0039DF4B3C
MDNKALKEFAVYARNELRNQIALRAQAFGITSEGSPVLTTGADYLEINGKKLDLIYRDSLQKLLKEIDTKGYDNVIEEIAYTWFNRLIAIRFMEVQNYLPSKIRVLSSETKGKIDPDILTEYQYADLPVNKEEVARNIAEGNREAGFRKLLVAQCNELHEIMPFLFEKVADYTELLLPESLLHADSLINQLVHEVEEGNFREVEVIGWLYQYYMSERKEQVGGLKNQAVSKENLPIVTQLFTPKWIVQYMVQNSLGKLYDEWNRENELVNGWEYYLKSSERLPIPEVNSVEDIKIIDPACGSGHILVYAFDLLYDMYLEAGYSEREIPRLILEKNIYGLDIDKRAIQMASFALMMKGQEKYRRFLKRSTDLKLNVYEFVDSQKTSKEALEFLKSEFDNIEWISSLQNNFINAKQFGSLIQPKQEAIDYLKAIQLIESMNIDEVELLEETYIIELRENLLPNLKTAFLLTLKYEIIVTNPPYHNKYNDLLKRFMNEKYYLSKSDLYVAFINRGLEMVTAHGFVSMVTPFNWMFLKAHETLRNNIIQNHEVVSLVQLEYNAFEVAMVPVCTFVLQNSKSYIPGDYIKLSDFKGANQQPIKTLEAIKTPSVYYRFHTLTSEFANIPGNPIAFWITDSLKRVFANSPQIGDRFELGEGLKTANNDRFLRYWFEIEKHKFGLGLNTDVEAKESKKKWFPHNKGGKFRKWYGNHDYVVNYENNGLELENFSKASKNKKKYYFKENISWSDISSSYLSVRYFPSGFIFDSKGPSIFGEYERLDVLLGFLNSKVSRYILNMFNPTLTFKAGYLAKLPNPIIENEKEHDFISNLVKQNIEISKEDWDNFEESWEFKEHLFTMHKRENKSLKVIFLEWQQFSEIQFRRLQQNEKELNDIFINKFNLFNDLTSEVLDEEITIRIADRIRDTKSFLSYCVGIIMGRYSLDVEGLAYAGGEWDASKYQSFRPDQDGIIPLTDTEYFEDDIISRLQELLVLMFGEDTLNENLQWLAESLTMKNNETPVERLRRYFFDEFYQDHCKVYQKRPIYWMAESGKKKGFRALFYLHRYTAETLATMRFSYVQNLQEKLTQEQKRLEQDLVNPELKVTTKKRYEKHLNMIKAQQDELVEFDKSLAELANQRIALDLDDGVVVNYAKLKDVLAKIK